MHSWRAGLVTAEELAAIRNGYYRDIRKAKWKFWESFLVGSEDEERGSHHSMLDAGKLCGMRRLHSRLREFCTVSIDLSPTITLMAFILEICLAHLAASNCRSLTTPLDDRLPCLLYYIASFLTEFPLAVKLVSLTK